MCVALCTMSASAQEFLWNVEFRTMLDNREYAEMQTSPSLTNFGAIIAPSIGIGFGDGHSIMLGGHVDRYFGKSFPKYDAEVNLYYQYEGPHLKINAGSFPYSRLTGEYPAAIVDEVLFFDFSLEGLLARYEKDTWSLELALDWVGMYDSTTRENFYVYSYGRKEIGPVYGAYSFFMNHYANSGQVKGVVDNVWLYPHIGVMLEKYLPLTKFDVRVGWLQTFQNNRITGTGYDMPGGFQAEVRLEKWGVGIYEMIYAGPSLMPYFYVNDPAGVQYATNLYGGIQFYANNSGIYNRLEVYYSPAIAKVSDYLDFKIAAVIQFDGVDWGWQQIAQLVVNLDSRQFKKNKAER